jgi:hypothetical protein
MAQQDIASILKNLIGEDTIRGISKTAGTEIPQTKTAVKTGLPKLIEGLSKNCESKEGAEALNTALDDHDGSILENMLGAVGDSNTQTDGAKILEHVFSDNGSSIIKNVASKAGISGTQATSILQTMAPLVLESLGKTKQLQGLNASGVTGVLTDLLNNKSGNSLLVTLLDQNKDGNIKDDLLTMLINWIKSLFFGK